MYGWNGKNAGRSMRYVVDLSIRATIFFYSYLLLAITYNFLSMFFKDCSVDRFQITKIIRIRASDLFLVLTFQLHSNATLIVLTTNGGKVGINTAMQDLYFNIHSFLLSSPALKQSYKSILHCYRKIETRNMKGFDIWLD